MGALASALFALFLLCCASARAGANPFASEDALGDADKVRAAENAFLAPGEEEEDQAESDAARVDEPLSYERRGRGVSPSPTTKPMRNASAAGGLGNNNAVMGGALFYHEDEEEEDEEEDIYNTEELEVVRMIRLSREEEKEKPAAWSGIGDAVNLHAPTQAIMWVLLAAVVYFIMRGATRGEEKQKSLEVHRGVLKTTIESLVRGKKEKQRLRKQRDAMVRDRTVLLRETIGMQTQLASMLSDIQQTGTLLEGMEGAGVGQIGAEDKLKERGDSLSSGTSYQVSGITVPGFESGPADLNKELQELLFNQGKTAFQENAVGRLADELRQKVALRNKAGGGSWDGMRQVGSLALEKAEKWFVEAADSLGASAASVRQHHTEDAQEEEGEQDGGSPRARSERDRKMDLLGLAAAMLRRKMSLEMELVDILEQTTHFPAAEEAALKEIRSASKSLKQVVSSWREILKKEFERVSALLDQEEGLSEDAREAVRHAYTSAMSTDVLLGKLLSLESKDCEVSAEDTQKASEVRLELLQMMQYANKPLAEYSKQSSGSSDLDLRLVTEEADQLGKSFSKLECSYKDTINFLANLHSQLLVYDLQKKTGIIQAAPLKEKAQTLSAQLEQTDRWLQQAMHVFSHV
ncbi:hypothetical protein Emed_007550 [Eimeria media]